MNDLDRTLASLARFLEEQRIGYMVIGGYANLKWGRSRLTQDIDVTVSIPESRRNDFLETVSRRFEILVENPETFLREMHVLPLRSPNGTRIDLVFAELPFEQQAITRAVAIESAGQPVRLCTAEDLLVHKLASDRPRDREDAEGIILRQGKALDRAYLDPLIEVLAGSLERPEILSFYRTTLQRAAERAGDRSDG